MAPNELEARPKQKVERREETTRPGAYFQPAVDILETRDELVLVADVGVLQRDAAPRPVDVAGVEARLVRPVDADRAARADVAVTATREATPLHREPVAMEILHVGVVEQQELPPARVQALVDDHVEAARRAEVALVELAARAVQTEDGGEGPHAGAVAVHVERAARLP